MKLLLTFHIQISLNPIVDVCNCAGILFEPFDGCESIFDNDENSYKRLDRGIGLYTKIHTLEIDPLCVDAEEVISFEFFTINTKLPILASRVFTAAKKVWQYKS